MPVFYDSVVFQPNRDTTNMQYINLCKVKRHLKYATHRKSGDRVYYFHLRGWLLRNRFGSPNSNSGGPMDENYGSSRERSGTYTSNSPPKENSGTVNTSGTDADIEAARARQNKSQFVILYSHGNAEDLGGCYPILKWVAFSLGCDVIAYDYRGYGFSGHRDVPASRFTPSDRTVYDDADLMYQHVLDLGYTANHVIIEGRSVGGGPACYLAEQHHNEVAAVILQSTFLSCLHVVSKCCLPTLLPCLNVFDNATRMHRITGCPILFMHGTDDQVVPFHCSGGLLSITLAERKKLTARAEKEYKALLENGSLCDDPSTPSNELLQVRTNEDCSPTSLGRGAAEHEHPAAFTQTRALVWERNELRVYTGGEVATKTAEEKQYGVFHQWFKGCGHNDIETQLAELYVNTVSRFLKFAKITSANAAAEPA